MINLESISLLILLTFLRIWVWATLCAVRIAPAPNVSLFNEAASISITVTENIIWVNISVLLEAVCCTNAWSNFIRVWMKMKLSSSLGDLDVLGSWAYSSAVLWYLCLPFGALDCKIILGAVWRRLQVELWEEHYESAASWYPDLPDFVLKLAVSISRLIAKYVNVFRCYDAECQLLWKLTYLGLCASLVTGDLKSNGLSLGDVDSFTARERKWNWNRYINMHIMNEMLDKLIIQPIYKV